MITTIQILVLLLIVIAAVAVIAARLKIPPAILLVLTGVVLALVPGLPAVELEPKFVLLLVLPPLVYAAAVAMSWREFRFNLRRFRCWPSAASSSRRSPSQRRAIGCWASPGPWASCWAPSSRPRMPWRRFRSPAECNFQGASLSFSKARGW